MAEKQQQLLDGKNLLKTKEELGFGKRTKSVRGNKLLGLHEFQNS